MRRQLFASVDEASALNGLRHRTINYDPARAPEDGQAEGHWHVDSGETVIGQEPPGPPVPGGPWETACTLVRQYEFAEPRILRGVYRASGELEGRDMLLEGRFTVLRFYLGVRVTGIIDETTDAERVWGWSYQTLDGHLEHDRLHGHGQAESHGHPAERRHDVGGWRRGPANLSSEYRRNLHAGKTIARGHAQHGD